MTEVNGINMLIGSCAETVRYVGQEESLLQIHKESVLSVGGIIMIRIWKQYRCTRCYHVRILQMSNNMPFCTICKARMHCEAWI